ncbi:galactose-1-phosphate uridylyltransferase [Geomonas limicola]|uniref:Galactose-1-phosphate uridylyltransferase n=1 Tax=Geomonas limicola TaxID=2740186 RepID=A0A6V8NC44_9BACT|nr:galactose-1-phosphate uridylyltransferase [Geomonas limicola]GFO70192.1 galactose-1-phosphate uridylyltransferase [Geomonas limicola]
MSELRWDPLKQHWVIIATDRGRRPRDFQVEPETGTLTNCPFCYGNEDKTPPEIFAIRPDGEPNQANWRVRVIPNKFPALRIEGDLRTRGYGPYDVMEGIGAHEVIIETPDHDRQLADLSLPEITDVLIAYRTRILDLRGDPRFRYLVLFKNHGKRAGSPISHSHSQLIAVPLTPPVAATELRVCQEFYEAKERCIFCDVVQFEIAEGTRVVREFGNFVTVTPYASCFPFELRLYPKRHSYDFALLSDAELMELAQALKDMLCRVKSVLRDPPYNFILHTAPPRQQRLGKPEYWGSIEYDYHWHIELVPRLTQIAGFEWGTGFYINPTSPEDAAVFLREVELDFV